MLLLSRSDVRASVSMPEAIEAAAQALSAYSSGETDIPLRTQLKCPGGVALYMPGLMPAGGALGAKLVSVFPGNPGLGLPTITSVLVLQDAGTGQPLALMEAGYLTALRTGAAAGVAASYLARKDASTLAVFGAGVQARTQIEALRAVLPVTRVTICDVSRQAAEALAAELAADGLSCRVAADRDDGVGEADLIVAATTAARPVFDGRRVRPGTHIGAIGSYTPEMQELDEYLVARADRLVCDTREHALAETGDLLVPLRLGLIGPGRVDAEVGDLVLGRSPGRVRRDEITVYKGVGLAALDLSVAKLVYARAKASGLGLDVDLST